MLKKFNNSKNDKGDGKMNSKNSLLRTVVALAGIFLIGITLLTGCGGANSTSGAGVDLSSNAAGSNASGTAAISYGAIEGKVVSLGSSITVENIPIILEQNSKIITSTKTITAGVFYFDKIPYGRYILKLEASNDYAQTAALVNLNSPVASGTELTLVSSLKIADIPTTNISGVFVAALDKTGLSVAQLTLDNGYKTVTDVFGNFLLPNVASGARSLEITKEGMKLHNINFSVNSDDGKNVKRVIYNGADYIPTATGTDLGEIPLTYELTTSGMITGTVIRIRKNNDGTVNKLVMPFFEFDIWMSGMQEKNEPKKIRTVYTEADGTFKLENLPDLPSPVMAVATGTKFIAQKNIDSQVEYYLPVNTSEPWISTASGTSPIYTSNYTVSLGKTTVIDLVLPSVLFP